MAEDVNLDLHRRDRVGLDEAVLCESKSAAQIVAICDEAATGGFSLLLTRLDQEKAAGLPGHLRDALDFDPVSRTAFFGEIAPVAAPVEAAVAVVTGGTSDAPVAREAIRTLAYYGRSCSHVPDAGVAGLWRLLSRVDHLAEARVVIVVAGMEGALATVVAGLVPGAVIAVPTSVGYGVANAGTTALHAALTSCAPGLVAVNIDNGFGAACAAIRMLGGRPGRS
jgi:NCAIR mutase (PurE)-related protein